MLGTWRSYIFKKIPGTLFIPGKVPGRAGLAFGRFRAERAPVTVSSFRVMLKCGGRTAVLPGRDRVGAGRYGFF